MSNDRFNELAFRKYESALIAFAANYPSATEVDPAPFAVETFAARIRDAVRGYRDNRWQSALDYDSFLQKWAVTQVIRKGQTVLLQPKTVAGASAVSVVNPPAQFGSDITSAFAPPPSRQGLVVTQPNLNIVRALMLLHSEHVLVQPTKVDNISPELMKYLQDQNEFDTIGIAFPTPTSCIFV
jgi:hypothetical protein